MNRAEKLAALALVVALGALALAAVAPRFRGNALHAPSPSGTTAAGDWLRASPEEQVRQLERHLRGTDVAMIEVGYRFNELHFAGEDGNWDYAKYLAEKMDLAIRLALERRPKRAASAQPFLNEDLPFVQQAIAAGDRAQFRQAMQRLRTGCMKCHVNEDLPFFTVEMPAQRLSSIRTIR